MALYWLVLRLSGDTTTRHDKTDKMGKLIDTTIHSVRRISSELRPGILDDFGLSAAMEWQSKEFRERTGIQCDFISDPESILDITMPGLNGLDTLKQLKKEKPDLPVLMLRMYPEEQYAIRIIKAGGSGYLTKESAPQELITAIRKVAQGGEYISASLSEKLATCLETDADKPLHERLSDREYQVVLMIAAGKTVGQIADDLALSVKTISTKSSRF